MRVVLASRLFAPEIAAAAFRLRALTTALADAGHRVTVLTTRAPLDAGPEPETGARVKRWPVLRDRNGSIRGYLQYASFDVPLAARLLLQPADVVVCEPPPSSGVVAAAVCGLRRIPLYYYAADVWSDALVAAGARRPVVAVMRALERIVLRRAAGVLAVSDGVAERVVALGAAPDRVEVVANGVDTEMFAPAGGATASGPVLVYTGTMSEWQGADVFVRALPEVRRRFPDVRLVFLGQGSAEGELRALAERLAPGAVEFGGVVPPAEAARALRAARGALVSIVPGRGYDFARPTKIYAATACGTPVLFAGTGDAAALVRDNELGLVAEHDPAAVAERMVELLSGTEADPAHLVAWTEQNASLRSTGRRAARWITGTRDGQSSGSDRTSRRAA